MRGPRLIALAAAAFTMLALAGCAGGGTTPPAAPREAADDTCRLLTPEEVGEALGTPVSVAEERSAVGALGRPGCEYSFQDEAPASATPAGGDTGRRPKAALTLLEGDEADRVLRVDEPGSRPAEPVDGLGDEAFFLPPHETLVVQRGAWAVVVDVGAYLHAHGPGAADALRADTRELATLALERLDR